MGQVGLPAPRPGHRPQQFAGHWVVVHHQHMHRCIQSLLGRTRVARHFVGNGQRDGEVKAAALVHHTVYLQPAAHQSYQAFAD